MRDKDKSLSHHLWEISEWYMELPLYLIWLYLTHCYNYIIFWNWIVSTFWKYSINTCWNNKSCVTKLIRKINSMINVKNDANNQSSSEYLSWVINFILFSLITVNIIFECVIFIFYFHWNWILIYILSLFVLNILFFNFYSKSIWWSRTK